MKKILILPIILCFCLMVCLSSCNKKEAVGIVSDSSDPIATYEDSSQISKNEEDGSFTFAFDPYVLPKEVKNEIGDIDLYKAFADAVIARETAVSIPTRSDYDNIRFAVGNNFPFAFLIENLKYDLANAQILITYNYDATHTEKISEFKNAIKAIFDECVVGTDDEVLAAMSLYRYIAQNFEIVSEEIKIVDPSEVASSEIPETEKNENIAEFDMYSTLINKKGTASSISSLYKFILMQLGIESKVVNTWVGETYYSWNMVRLGSKWYHCDITKENKATSGAGLKYFGMSIERLKLYLTDTNITTGEWTWFTSDIPKAKSNKFKELETVVSWEEGSERNSINAFTEEYSRFSFEF